jgi:hypothetical protein
MDEKEYVTAQSTALSPVASRRSDEEYVLVPISAIRWLLGEGPDAHGNHFGNEEAYNTARGRYWWRSEFRHMLASAPPYVVTRHIPKDTPHD